jgi:hypothetical protein
MASEGVLATLRGGWNALSGVPAPKAVIGGLALAAWNHDAIDFVRLQQEVAQQGIAAEYRQVWSDAFPSEAMPRLE